MKRFCAAIVAAAAAGTLLLGAAPAMAKPAGPPSASLTVIPTVAHQGEAFGVIAACSEHQARPIISSPLLRHPVVLPGGGGTKFLVLWVTFRTRPGTYPIKLTCWTPWGVHAWKVVWVTVLRHHFPPRHPVLPFPCPDDRCVFVETGFGGMASQVAQHHPAG